MEGIGDGGSESEILGEFLEHVEVDNLGDFQGFQNDGGKHARNVRV